MARVFPIYSCALHMTFTTLTFIVMYPPAPELFLKLGGASAGLAEPLAKRPRLDPGDGGEARGKWVEV